jgi:hypothetical protein
VCPDCPQIHHFLPVTRRPMNTKFLIAHGELEPVDFDVHVERFFGDRITVALDNATPLLAGWVSAELDEQAFIDHLLAFDPECRGFTTPMHPERIQLFVSKGEEPYREVKSVKQGLRELKTEVVALSPNGYKPLASIRAEWPTTPSYIDGGLVEGTALSGIKGVQS